MEIRTQKSTEVYIPKNALVKVVQAGHVLEISHSTQQALGLANIKRISKDHYIYTDTGEIGTYRNGETKAETLESLRRTLHRLRMIINANFEGGESELFITLTYTENMTNRKRLYSDYEAFTKRLRRRYPNLELLAITEPQKRGAWHLHVLAKDTTGARLYIHYDEIRQLWGNGATDTRRLQDCDNVGAYLTAYLTNLDTPYVEGMENSKEFQVVEIEGKKKAFIKGARLHLYPAGMKIYRATKGIIRPTVEKMAYEKAKEKARGSTPSFQQKIEILGLEDGTERPLQTVQYQQFNTKRKSCQNDVNLIPKK